MEKQEEFHFYGPERRSIPCEWRGLFSEKILKDAAALLQEKKFVVSERGEEYGKLYFEIMEGNGTFVFGENKLK